MKLFANHSSESVSQLGELALIERIRDRLGTINPPSPAGIGDDCAVFAASAPETQQLVTTDPVIYGKHFDDRLTPRQVAEKLLKRNLSDIAAMGGKPKMATLSLGLADNVSTIWIDAFIDGLARCASDYETQIVGGDVSSAPDGFLGAFLTLIGESTPGTRVLERHKGAEGSPIYVTGELGGSGLGKHYAFTPRLAEGAWLAKSETCLSCTDISDGLGKDFASILGPALQAEIDCLKIPLSSDAKTQSHASGKHALYHAFNDGEDFELLFALSPKSDTTAFERAWARAFPTRLSQIGVIASQTDESALRLLNAPEHFETRGYEHLK